MNTFPQNLIIDVLGMDRMSPHQQSRFMAMVDESEFMRQLIKLSDTHNLSHSILHYKYNIGMTYKDIAAKLGISVKTVRKYRNMAFEILRSTRARDRYIIYNAK